MDLVYKNEKKLFAIAVVISAIAWLVLIGVTFGIALLYLLLGFLVYLFAQSAFISYLKGTGVKVTETQYPDLHARLVKCCGKVGQEKLPELYLLRTDFFNALATRFLRRDFVVLFTDVVDALEDKPNALDFYIGHEVGHIHRKHLVWGWFLFPALMLPLLGTAYRRAEEYTCDRYGTACCDSEEDVCAAIATIAAGDTRWKTINTDAYLSQVAETKGFWMSFNELTSDYPWLTKRMAVALSAKRGVDVTLPSRSILAWLLSIFVPRFGAGGSASLLITVAMIGILAAVAVPAYQDYTKRASYTVAYQAALPVRDAVGSYAVQNQAWPKDLTELGYESAAISGPAGKYTISMYDSGVIGASVGVDAAGEKMYIVLEPYVEEGQVYWSCYGQNLAEKYLPPGCE